VSTSDATTDGRIRVTLYGRADCHLCEEMRAVVERVAREIPLLVDEIDVDDDPALVDAYGADVPVLCVNGRRAFKYRVDPAALRARLARER
jgi:hypothetical protein